MFWLQIEINVYFQNEYVNFYMFVLKIENYFGLYFKENLDIYIIKFFLKIIFYRFEFISFYSCFRYIYVYVFINLIYI